MPSVKINLKSAPGLVNLGNLRKRCRAHSLTITGLAEQLGCSREAIYFALEKPSRFSRVYRLIQDKLK